MSKDSKELPVLKKKEKKLGKGSKPEGGYIGIIPPKHRDLQIGRLFPIPEHTDLYNPITGRPIVIDDKEEKTPKIEIRLTDEANKDQVLKDTRKQFLELPKSECMPPSRDPRPQPPLPQPILVAPDVDSPPPLSRTVFDNVPGALEGLRIHEANPAAVGVVNVFVSGSIFMGPVFFNVPTQRPGSASPAPSVNAAAVPLPPAQQPSGQWAGASGPLPNTPMSEAKDDGVVRVKRDMPARQKFELADTNYGIKIDELTKPGQNKNPAAVQELDALIELYKEHSVSVLHKHRHAELRCVRAGYKYKNGAEKTASSEGSFFLAKVDLYQAIIADQDMAVDFLSAKKKTDPEYIFFETALTKFKDQKLHGMPNLEQLSEKIEQIKPKLGISNSQCCGIM